MYKKCVPNVYQPDSMGRIKLIPGHIFCYSIPFPLKPSATQSAFPSRTCDVPSISIPHTGNMQFPLLAHAYAIQSNYKAHLKTCGTRCHTCDCGQVFSRYINIYL